MADSGLLSGIGQGLQNFLGTYMQVRNQQEASRQKDLNMALQTKAAGLQMNQEGTGYDYTPEKQKQVDFENQAYDPNSARSIAGRKTREGLLNSVGVNSSGLIDQNSSLKDLNDADDIIKSTATIKGSLLKEKAGEAAKAPGKQDDKLKSIMPLLEGARGNPAAAQAERDIYAADKADSLAKLYGDPNKLSTPQVNLLVSEVGKIAQGGVPAMHELEGLSPGTLQGALSSTWSKLSNNPTPANAGAFVKQYQDYTKALRGDAQKVIQDKYGRIIESNKAALGDSNYNILKSQYLDRFNKPETQAAQVAPDVLQYAKSHGITPEQAQAIKEARGGK